MSVKKFIAKSTVEALRLVKKDLGADAVIISNKKIEGGVEILAVNHNDLESISEENYLEEESSVLEKEETNDDFCIDDFCESITSPETYIEKNKKDSKKESISVEKKNTDKKEVSPEELKIDLKKENKMEYSSKRVVNHEGLIPKKIEEKKSDSKKIVANHANIFEDINNKKNIIKEVEFESIGSFKEEETIKEISLENSQAKTLLKTKNIEINEGHKVESVKEDSKIPTEILLELRTLRKLLDNKLAKLKINGNSNIKMNALKKLLSIGFSAKVSKELMLDFEDSDMMAAELSLRGQASKLIDVVRVSDDIVNKGGIYALLGPTGVGKTTTAAKIAAKAVEKYGSTQVALVSTDTYRIAAHEQLKIYGKLLGVSVSLVKEGDDMQKILSKLKTTKKIIIIDTVGMSQKDNGLPLMLDKINDDSIEKMLILPANAKGEVLDDIVHKYTSMGVSGVIISKEDESVGLATVLDATIRNHLPIYYICNGQRVPEDIAFPNKKSLIAKAFIEFKNDLVDNLSNVEIALLMAKYEVFED